MEIKSKKVRSILNGLSISQSMNESVPMEIGKVVGSIPSGSIKYNSFNIGRFFVLIMPIFYSDIHISKIIDYFIFHSL